MKPKFNITGTLVDKQTRTKEVFAIFDIDQSVNPTSSSFSPFGHPLRYTGNDVLTFTTDYRFIDMYSSVDRRLIVDYGTAVFTVFYGYVTHVDVELPYIDIDAENEKLNVRAKYKFQVINQEDFRPAVFKDKEIQILDEICENVGWDIFDELADLRNSVQTRLALKVREKYERFD